MHACVHKLRVYAFDKYNLIYVAIGTLRLELLYTCCDWNVAIGTAVYMLRLECCDWNVAIGTDVYTHKCIYVYAYIHMLYMHT